MKKVNKCCLNCKKGKAYYKDEIYTGLYCKNLKIFTRRNQINLNSNHCKYWRG